MLGCSNNTPSPTSVPLTITEVNPVCGVVGETIIITGTSFTRDQAASYLIGPATDKFLVNTQIEVLVLMPYYWECVVTVAGSATGFGLPFLVIPTLYR